MALAFDETACVATQRAVRDDRDALVQLATEIPLRRALELVFGPSADDDDTVRRYQQWNVDVLLAAGAIYIDDGLTSIAGGRAHPPNLSNRLRLAALPPWRKGALRGRYRYPPLPANVRHRLTAVSRASMSLVPAGRSFHWSLWGAKYGEADLESVGRALLNESAGAGLQAVATVTDDETASMAHLEMLGFQRTGEVPLPGAEATKLVGWLHQ